MMNIMMNNRYLYILFILYFVYGNSNVFGFCLCSDYEIGYAAIDEPIDVEIEYYSHHTYLALSPPPPHPPQQQL